MGGRSIHVLTKLERSKRPPRASQDASLPLPARTLRHIAVLAGAACALCVAPLAGQEGCVPLERIDSLYFHQDPLGSLEAARGEGPCGTETPARRWRAMRALVSEGLKPQGRGHQNGWMDQAIALLDESLAAGSPTLNELFWGAAAEGHRALNSTPRVSARLATRARDHALQVLAVDSLHGGAHYVLGRVAAEVNSLSRLKRMFGKLVMGGDFPSGLSWDDAEVHLRRAAQLWPTMILFQVDLARVLIRRDHEDEARLILRRVLDMPPIHPPDPFFKKDAEAMLRDLGNGGG